MSRAGLGVAGSYPLPRARPPAATVPSRGAVTGRLPPRQIRRCRRRFRTTATGRTRTPSLGSTRTLRPEQAQLRSLFTFTASPRTLSLAASLGLPRQRLAGRLELPRAPAPPCDGRPSIEKDASHRFLQPTPVTSTLRTARFLVAPAVTRHLSVARGPRASFDARDDALTHPGPEPGGGEAREPADRVAG